MVAIYELCLFAPRFISRMQGALFAPASRVVARVYFDLETAPRPSPETLSNKFSLSVGEGGRHLVQVQLLEPLRPRVEHREQAVVDERRVRPWDARRALRDERALKLGV